MCIRDRVNVNKIADSDLNAFKEMGNIAGRPWVMLSAGAGKEEFKNVLKLAFKAGCSGFLAGRAIWLDAFMHYPNWDKIQNQLESNAKDYLDEIGEMADKSALSWNNHVCYGKDGSNFPYDNQEFRQHYNEIE